MAISTVFRRRTRAVAIVDLILSIFFFITFYVWLGLNIINVKDWRFFIDTDVGLHLLFLSVLITCYTLVEGSLSIFLLVAVLKENRSQIKAWFLIQTVCLPIITLGFLFDLTSPHIPILPFFLVVLIKSLSLWIVSQLVDEITAEEQHQNSRLISPFDPPDNS